MELFSKILREPAAACWAAAWLLLHVACKLMRVHARRHAQVGPEQDHSLLHKANETECGSCYGAGAEDECCNTCDEVRVAAFLQREACTNERPLKGHVWSVTSPSDSLPHDVAHGS